MEKSNLKDGSYTTLYRQLDTDLQRWWSVDPKASAHESPYVSMGNNPVLMTDFLGDTTYYYNNVGELLHTAYDNLDNAVTIIKDDQMKKFKHLKNGLTG